jgi:hypothetical protein
MAALTFSFDTLRTGGHFLCKFYQGSEDKALETKLKRLFAKVHREKPDSSRSVQSLILRGHSSQLTRSTGEQRGVFCGPASKREPY